MERLVTLVGLIAATAGFIGWILTVQSKMHDLELRMELRLERVEEKHRSLCWWVAEDFYRGEPNFGCE